MEENIIDRKSEVYILARAQRPEPEPGILGAELLDRDIPIRVDADVRGDVERLLDDRLGIEIRSEEHTSELQSRENLVCRLLLEKKKNKKEQNNKKTYEAERARHI